MENQEILFNLSMMEQQMQQMQQQLQAIDNTINNLETLNLDLREIDGSEGKEIMAQIGSGIYIPAKITSEELIVNVGNKTLVKKNVAQTGDLISTQIKKLKDIREELVDGLEKTHQKFNESVEEYQKSENSKE